MRCTWPTSRWRMARLLVTNASGLLISCATPATILPMAESVSDWTSWLSARFSSWCVSWSSRCALRTEAAVVSSSADDCCNCRFRSSSSSLAC